MGPDTFAASFGLQSRGLYTRLGFARVVRGRSFTIRRVRHPWLVQANAGYDRRYGHVCAEIVMVLTTPSTEEMRSVLSSIPFLTRASIGVALFRVFSFFLNGGVLLNPKIVGV